MENLFIDTNRYFTIFYLGPQEIDQIKKLAAQVRAGKIRLWLPEQVKNEVDRRIDTFLFEEKYEPLAKKIEECEDIKLRLTEKESPYYKDEIAKVNNHISQIKGILQNMKQNAKSNVMQEAALPKSVVDELFSSATLIRHNHEQVSRAMNRKSLGNPPGKNSSVGDSLIWESLLDSTPPNEDLHFVGFDKDFRSKMDDSRFADFLVKEWRTKKGSAIIPYQKLGEYTKKRIPEIENTISNRIIRQESKLEKSLFNPVPDIFGRSNSFSQMVSPILNYGNTRSNSLLGNIIAGSAFQSQYGPQKVFGNTPEEIEKYRKDQVEELRKTMNELRKIK